MSNYESLDVWKQAMELVKDVYLLVKKFPKEELFGLTSQIKRAAVSIPANIAEGTGRNYKRDTIQFLHISRVSLYELETLINIAFMISLVTEDSRSQILSGIGTCLRQLNGLIRYYEESSLK